MTDNAALKKFLKTFNEGSFDEGRTLIEFIDSSIDFFTISELKTISQQLSEYLASEPADVDLEKFWRASNKTVSFGNSKGIRIFLKKTLDRLQFHSIRH